MIYMPKNSRRFVFRPFSLLYFGLLLLFLIVVFPILFVAFRNVFIEGLGLPPEVFGSVLFLSLIGSYINLPLTTIETKVPIYTYKKVRTFFVTWRIPTVEMGVKKTYVTINMGGGVVPILISGYLVLWAIPRCSIDLVQSYGKLLTVLVIVAYTTYRSSRIVKGLGIATPMFGPPLMTAFSTFAVDVFSPVSCPAQIAYVGGTIGTLIGADLFNLPKLPELGAPVVSIGGAGTFDGIYLTGIISVLLVLLLG
ncbi:DUF1614 domain-containing protein [Candidatus Bathyarchaeota archaeon]|nr:DUF1614 domain-containing protein [Candidatus Bathyarchaeota archaeon]